MQTYIVLYIEPDLPEGLPPQAFRCQADDHEHAREQCQDAYPDAIIHSSVLHDN
jgi:hypothetical protein